MKIVSNGGYSLLSIPHSLYRHYGVIYLENVFPALEEEALGVLLLHEPEEGPAVKSEKAAFGQAGHRYEMT